MASRTRLTRSSQPRLVALLDGVAVGKVYQSANGRLAFRYDREWQQSAGAYPLSLAMPLAATEHGDRAIRAFLWGLMPDNPEILAWWARRYGVSRYRIVDLLAHVGEDCAGAVQFAPPARADALLGRPTKRDETQSIQWITVEELEARLRELRLNPAAGRAANDTGQFSLAGAQPKTALFQDDTGRWGIPRGRVPTTRILKPPTLGLDDLAYNEHFCLAVARALGLPAAQSRVETFGTETVIVVERYDRVRLNGRLVRVHQEDLCQARAVPPTRKYEADGGPGIADICESLMESSSEPELDRMRLLEAVALNWLLAASDGHAKNFSLLHAHGPQTRLAPLYDIITVLPYPQLTSGRNTVAMGIAGERLVEKITGEHWRRLARQVGIAQSDIIAMVSSLAARLPRAVEEVRDRTLGGAQARAALARIGAAVTAHAARCAKRL